MILSGTFHLPSILTTLSIFFANMTLLDCFDLIRINLNIFLLDYWSYPFIHPFSEQLSPREGHKGAGAYLGYQQVKAG